MTSAESNRSDNSSGADRKMRRRSGTRGSDNVAKSSGYESGGGCATTPTAEEEEEEGERRRRLTLLPWCTA